MTAREGIVRKVIACEGSARKATVRSATARHVAMASGEMAAGLARAASAVLLSPPPKRLNRATVRRTRIRPSPNSLR